MKISGPGEDARSGSTEKVPEEARKDFDKKDSKLFSVAESRSTDLIEKKKCVVLKKMSRQEREKMETKGYEIVDH